MLQDLSRHFRAIFRKFGVKRFCVGFTRKCRITPRQFPLLQILRNYVSQANIPIALFDDSQPKKCHQTDPRIVFMLNFSPTRSLIGDPIGKTPTITVGRNFVEPSVFIRSMVSRKFINWLCGNLAFGVPLVYGLWTYPHILETLSPLLARGIDVSAIGAPWWHLFATICVIWAVYFIIGTVWWCRGNRWLDLRNF